jgi:hypothetical protein
LKRNEERKEKKKKGECHENFAVTRLTIKIIYQAAIAPQQKLPKQKNPRNNCRFNQNKSKFDSPQTNYTH